MNSDDFWKWITRACAVGGFISLIITVGFKDAPWGAYILLIGLFFGPDVLKGTFGGITIQRNGNGGKKNGKS